MQPNSQLPFPLSPFILFNGGELSEGGFELSRFVFLGSLLFSQGGEMDLSKVGEKILSSVRSARSLGLLPSSSDRPDVPERAAAAAVAARVLAGLPPHQRHNFSSSSDELNSIYGSKPRGQVIEEIEEEFFEEEFDPVCHVLQHIPSEENELFYLEEKASLRLAQLDRISERLSRHVMEHHEEMVKGMNLVRELEKDLKVANVICMNGRRYITSSRIEVSRDLIVTKSSKKKQALLDMLPILADLRQALDMQVALETHVDEGNFSKAFQVLSEYLQFLDSLSELTAVQEMSHGVEVWLGKTLQKLDSLLIEVCQDFKKESYLTVLDAYSLIGDVSGLGEKIQSFFMQEVLSETHSVLKSILLEDLDSEAIQSSRLTYSDLCMKMPESKLRQCLLATLAVLFKLMCAYYTIMSFELEEKVNVPKHIQHSDSKMESASSGNKDEDTTSTSMDSTQVLSFGEESKAASISSCDSKGPNDQEHVDYQNGVERDGGSAASSSGSPWYQLRKDAISFVSQTLKRGRKNFWHLTTSRVAVLLSSSAVCSASTHQFLKNYEDLSVFILSGEAFCGSEALEFRQKVKAVCEIYFAAFHRQNIHALKMVMEKESWEKIPPESIQVVSFAGLLGDGAALLVSSNKSPKVQLLRANRSVEAIETYSKRSGFEKWLQKGNPFFLELSGSPIASSNLNLSNGSTLPGEAGSPITRKSDSKAGGPGVNGNISFQEDENEDLHADFIDEDSQLPSRISIARHPMNHYLHSKDEEVRAQTGTSLSLLRSMDKYARLMQKLELINVEFFKGIRQLFGIFFNFIFETSCQFNINHGGKGLTDPLSCRLKTALSKATQDCEQWIMPQSPSVTSSSPTSSSTSLAHIDVTPISPPSHLPSTASSLKEICTAADSISLVADLLHRSKAHLQKLLLQNNVAIVEDFYAHLVDAVPDLIVYIHRTTARPLLNIDGYADRIASAKWEVKELGMEHNGYVDLLLGEFKHYKTGLVHGGIRKEVQDLLLESGVEIVAETLVEGLSRVKRCTDEGRALMSLDLQWIMPQSPSVTSSSPTSSSTSLAHIDVTPISPPSHLPSTASSLKEICTAADSISLVADLLHRSKAHLQKLLLQNNVAIVEDFYAHLVDAVPDLIVYIHRTTARPLLNIDGYADRIASAKWEVKELGMEHNGYVDLLLGEFKHYKTGLVHGGIRKEVQDLLLESGVEIVAETLVEGLSRVKRCTDEGRALMSLDLQVLINGLKHFVPIDVKPKLQIVEAFIKAYYLPETEYVHWARAHPEYSKNQIVGLINLVAAMKSWKRKTRLEVLEKIE